jgi:hypothetical protein
MCKCKYLVNLVQDRDILRDFVNAAMKFRVPQNTEEFLDKLRNC